MVQPVRRLAGRVEHLGHAGQAGAELRDRREVGRVADVDVGDLVVGDGERPRRPRVQVLHAVLGVDLQQPLGAQQPVDVDRAARRR